MAWRPPPSTPLHPPRVTPPTVVVCCQVAGNAVKRATDALVKAAQQVKQDWYYEESDFSVDLRMVGGLAEVTPPPCYAPPCHFTPAPFQPARCPDEAITPCPASPTPPCPSRPYPTTSTPPCPSRPYPTTSTPPSPSTPCPPCPSPQPLPTCLLSSIHLHNIVSFPPCWNKITRLDNSYLCDQ